jgi:hypothetical protein
VVGAQRHEVEEQPDEEQERDKDVDDFPVRVEEEKELTTGHLSPQKWATKGSMS